MSAERLREAAKVVRARARAATPGPWSGLASNVWHFTDDRSTLVVAGNGAAKVQRRTTEARQADAAFIATMHPGVALALADLLETLAFDREVNGEIDGRTWDHDIVPLADLILGSES